MAHDLVGMIWEDHPNNPLISATPPGFFIADPSVLTPDRTPDGRWHLYANSLGWVRHYVSDDGLAWRIGAAEPFLGIRPCLFVEDGRYFLLYERFKRPWHSGIAVRSSNDLVHWDAPRQLLLANARTDGGLIRFLGNPNLVKIQDTYHLYFSYNWVFLPDCMFPEPKFVGVATARSLLGPYERQPQPLIGPSKDDPTCNMGAGCVKLLANGSEWWVFNNRIYRDAAGHSRSAIFLLRSTNGQAFEMVSPEPIVAPGAGWKRAFVYACCPVVCGDDVRLYYNARDGWLKGAERIGMASARRPTT